MKTCTKCRETKPLDLFPWCKDHRLKAGGRIGSRCKACGNVSAKVWNAAHQEIVNARADAWRAANRERWNTAVLAAGKRYSFAKTNRVPPWFDATKAKEVYDFAAEFRQAGFEVDVDHIVPLQGKTFSGLHWHGNLRVCLAGHNRSRRNRLSPFHDPLGI